MNNQQQRVVVIKLLDALKKNGSWCGETHIQKAVFFLKAIKKVPVDFNFILYKHGPFSFDLRDHLPLMRLDGLIDMVINPIPYGPSLKVTDRGEKFLKQCPKTVKKYKDKVNFIARFVGSKKVAELERLGTALYITLKEDIKDIRKRARLINKKKSHISVEEATFAVKSIDDLLNSHLTREENNHANIETA